MNKYDFLPNMLEWKYGCVADTQGSEITAWRHTDLEQPSSEQIGLDLDEYLVYLQSISYQEKRKNSYPAIGDQLDIILKYLTTKEDLTEDMKTLINTCNNIKTKYPKGE